jgi:pimeloyl-ACP methyl ester carboxylesterase
VTGFAREYWFVPTTPPAVVDRVLGAATTFPPEIALPALRETWSYDAASAFDAVRVPIVAVNADRFPTNVAGNRKHAPQFDAVIMKGVAHYLLLEDPKRFGDHLEEALARIAASSSRRDR